MDLIQPSRGPHSETRTQLPLPVLDATPRLALLTTLPLLPSRHRNRLPRPVRLISRISVTSEGLSATHSSHWPPAGCRVESSRAVPCHPRSAGSPLDADRAGNRAPDHLLSHDILTHSHPVLGHLRLCNSRRCPVPPHPALRGGLLGDGRTQQALATTHTGHPTFGLASERLRKPVENAIPSRFLQKPNASTITSSLTV